jgi:hypothetical protein
VPVVVRLTPWTGHPAARKERGKEATMRKRMLVMGLSLVIPALASAGHDPLAPGGLVPVPLGGEVELIWPYTGQDYSGTPTDPINIALLGNADPRAVRQILFGLDGDRQAWGFPDTFPFNCTWKDAVGRPQTSYAASTGWEGSAIQLECGDYALLRTHLRLFRHGSYTLGGAHFEVQIPGTSTHQVLAWELAEQLVTVDLLRSGLAALQPPTGPISEAPVYRTILPEIFNGLPPELRHAIALDLPDQEDPVPIPNDGSATVFSLGGHFEPIRSKFKVVFDHPFGQAIPKPFCSSGELLWVSGSVHMTQSVQTGRDGRYTSHFEAFGILDLVPIDTTGQAIGTPFRARVSESYHSQLTDRRQTASMKAMQVLLTKPTQWLAERLRVGQHKDYVLKQHCGPCSVAQHTIIQR